MKNTFKIMMASLLILTGAGCTSANTNSHTSSVISEKTDEVDGGWTVNTESLKPEDHQDAQEAFNKAVQNLTGYEYTVLAYLGSQAVSGTNYAFLCEGKAVTPEAEKEYCIVYVYEDLDGNAEITSTMDLADTGSWTYNQESSSLSDNQEVQKAFDQAMEGLTGASYEPIAWIASDTDHDALIFCRITISDQNADAGYGLVTLHMSDEPSFDEQDIELGDETNTSQIANPFTEVSSMDEAEDLTGFAMTLPETPSEFPDVTIQVMNNTMIEVIYSNDGTEGYRIRKASGSEDISGDYNTYEKQETVDVDGRQVTEKGNGDTISTASWTDNGYSYAVDAEDSPLTSEEIATVITAVR